MSILYPSLSLTPPHPTCHQIPSILLPPKYLSNLFSHPSPISNPQQPWYFQSIADLYHTMSLLSSSLPSPAGLCCSKKQHNCNSLATVMGHRDSLGRDEPSSLFSSTSGAPPGIPSLSVFSVSVLGIESLWLLPSRFQKGRTQYVSMSVPGTHCLTFQLQRCS